VNPQMRNLLKIRECWGVSLCMPRTYPACRRNVPKDFVGKEGGLMQNDQHPCLWRQEILSEN
jgi:hypothetical protein